jgi:nitroreductase
MTDGENGVNQGLAGVTDAVLSRRSVRAFTNEPVPPPVIEAILSAALRSPSGGNVQPWHIHVVSGESLTRLIDRVQAKQSSGGQEAIAHPIYPENLWEPYRSRRFENGEELYRTIGIERSDKISRLSQVSRNFELFGAPVGLFFAIDRRMGAAQWIDLGMIMQSVMLLAIEHDSQPVHRRLGRYGPTRCEKNWNLPKP